MNNDKLENTGWEKALLSAVAGYEVDTIPDGFYDAYNDILRKLVYTRKVNRDDVEIFKSRIEDGLTISQIAENMGKWCGSVSYGFDRVLSELKRPINKKILFGTAINNKDNEEIPIESLHLSTHALNCLKRGGFHTLRDVSIFSFDEFQTIRDLGMKTYFEISTSLKKYGIEIEGEEEGLNERQKAERDFYIVEKTKKDRLLEMTNALKTTKRSFEEVMSFLQGGES